MTGRPMQTSDVRTYYAERAAQYDRVYAKRERQPDIGRLAERLVRALARAAVLEVACGTGFWTQFFAPAARSVRATDCNDAVLRLAAARLAHRPNVAIEHADAYALAGVDGLFDAGFAGFLWSHVEKARLGGFLDGFHRKIEPGGRVVFADNLYVHGSSTPISRTDADGNTYQWRYLDDGQSFEVLKNFPTEAEFRHAVGDRGRNVWFERFDFFWCAGYELAD